VPDWLVLPGGNLGNCAAFGKSFLELRELGFIDRLPRFAVVQAAGSAPFYEFMKAPSPDAFRPVTRPDTLATAIRIGDPVSWPKAWAVLKETNGIAECVTEQEIADAKAIIGKSGIGCEPASAASLAGVRRLRAAGVIAADAYVVAVLTGNLLKDPDYIYRYHTGQLKTAAGAHISPTFGNQPRTVEGNPAAIERLLQTL
jgi:threonine synthase